MKSESNLEKILEAGHFAFTGELGPPRGTSAEEVKKKAAHLKGNVDAVNITDNQTAVVRMSSWAACILLIQEGLEPNFQMVCRDRNRLAMQSDILGAYAHGIRNMLCLSGDHQKFGDHPQALGVFDIDSMQLINMVKKMRDEGKFMSGAEIEDPPKIFIGAASNPFAEPFEMRLIRLYKKIEAGAHFIQTQPVFDLEIFTRWMDRVVAMGLHEKTAILAGVMPVRSAKALLYMKEEVPGVKINDEYIDRMKQASDPKEEGVKMAVEIIQTLKKITGIRGIHLMPVMWESITPTIIKKAGIL